MISEFIITFRETLEVALVVGIVLSYLARTKQTKYNNVVYVGIGFGIVASIIGALIFIEIYGGFGGKEEEIFEGITMLVGAVLLTTMILWMIRQKHIAEDIKQRVLKNIEEASKVGLFLLVFIAVLREGIETVIFLGAASFASAGFNFMWAFLGVIAAIFLGYLLFVGSMKINIKYFFTITSILLILFSAGLVAQSIHEFQEAGILPAIVEHVWDINPEVNPDGSYPLLHEKGGIGGLFKELFGYNGDPSLLELISYAYYILIILLLWKIKR